MAAVENNEINTAVDKEEHQQYPVAYHPIPRFVIKEEPISDEDQDERNEERQFLKAYPPLPHGEIKEESQFLDDRDEFTFNGGQLMTQLGRNLDQTRQEPDAQSRSSIIPFVESPDTDNVNYSEPTRTKKRKKTVKGVALSGDDTPLTSAPGSDYLKGGRSTVKMPSSRNLHSQGRSSLMVLDGVKNGKRNYRPTEELEDTGAKKQQQVAKCEEKIGTAGQFSSLKDAQSDEDASDDDLVPKHSATGTSTTSQKTVGKRSAKVFHLKGKEKPFDCVNCGRSFKAAEYLKQHLAKTCGIEPQFICKDCGHRFKQKAYLRQHLMKIHNVEKSQLATFGAGPTIRPGALFKCDKCGNTYKQKRTITYHMKNNCGVDSSLPCTLCDFGTSRKSDLRRHLMRVHSVDRAQFSAFGAAGLRVRPDLPYKCEKCGRSYKNKRHLSRHLKYECGVNPSFSCTHCDYRAFQKVHLQSHVTNVHGVTASQSSQPSN